MGNELENIKGIGKQTADMLLKEYRSVNNIRQLSLADLEKFAGKSKAGIIYSSLHAEMQQPPEQNI